MKSTDYIRIALLVAATALGGCDASSSFTGPPGVGGGGLSGSSGGSGGSGGTGSGIEPIMQFDTDYLFDDFVAGRISGDGSTMVWVDTDDPVGTNPDGRTHLFAKSLGTGAVTQLTLGSDRFSYVPREWDVTDNGDFVVFASSLDIVGDNPDTEGNVFVATADGSSITQVTRINANSHSVGDPQIANSGVMVFSTAADLTGDNLTGSTQIFSINFDGTGLAQVTTGDLGVRDLALADDGNRIAFTSNRDPFGTNVPSTDEIFVIDIDGSNLTQLTETDAFSEKPRISDDGTRVAFYRQGEIFVAMADGSATVQVTDSGTSTSGRYAGVGTTSTTPSNPLTGPGSFDISGDGNTLVFASNADHTGDNPNGNHTLFSVSTGGAGTPVQILRTGTVSLNAPDLKGDRPSVVTNGTGVLFISQTNLTSVDQQPTSFKIYTADIQ